MKLLTGSLKSAAAVAVCALSLQAAVPSGWSLGGTKPKDYDCSVDPSATYNGLPSAYLKSKDGATATGFGTVAQYFSAAPYVGKRVRLSANLKSDGVEQGGSLWMRVDNGATVVAFDNMFDGDQDRSIKGTTSWQNYSVVLDVPENATAIFIGFLLTGKGALWANDFKVEIVGADVPVTGKLMTHKSFETPTNLSFEK